MVDENNTSGFGAAGKVPLVAIFTNHDPKGEKAGTKDFQTQSIAYSLDNGDNWTKYKGNPVIKNPGIRDFRDPKVRWHEATKKWMMTLATADRITFYSSPNLKNWNCESEFGATLGAHSGVWECPDLFPMALNGKTHWILIVSIGSGGPNKGSATQYFVGDFDGHAFKPRHTDTRWIDYGPDDYAGITWYNTGKRHIFLGWMSNWIYANHVPTEKWRNAMTIPRELALKKVRQKLLIISTPVKELEVIKSKPLVWKNLLVDKIFTLPTKTVKLPEQYAMRLSSKQIKSYRIVLSNAAGEELIIGYDKAKNEYFIDRSRSGNTTFNNWFSGRYIAPRLSAERNTDLTLVVDNSSVELFADSGVTVMTSLFYPTTPYTQLSVVAEEMFNLKTFELTTLNTIH